MVLLFFLFVAVSIVSTEGVDLASPEVFDPLFYVSNNVEVLHAGVRDVTSAKNHWLQHGIQMGLQAAGNFHSKQYLARYPPLAHALGNNSYKKAVTHFLTHGIQEGRLGYQEGGFEGRWTVSDQQHRLFVSASRRMGASIDSLVWDNREFVNNWDHGRQLQMAMNFPPNGECFNPTEAGGRDDGQLNTTHTNIQEVEAHGNRFRTKVLPSFWLQPGDHQIHSSGDHCQAGYPALNTAHFYSHPFNKTVTVDCPGVSQPCLLYQSTFTVADDIPDYDKVQMVGPSCHLPGDFTKVQSLNPETGHLQSYNSRKPIIISTQDDRYATGAFAPPGQDGDQIYGLKQVPGGNYLQATNKWNVVYRKTSASLAGGTHVQNYHVFICMGTVSDVTACLKSLMAQDHQNLIG